MADNDPIEFVLYDNDFSTKLSILPFTKGRIYLEFQEPGSGEVQIPLDSDAASLIEYGLLVLAYYRGDIRFGFFIENIKIVEADNNENSGRLLSFSGRGLLSILDDAIIWDDSTGATTRSFQEQTKGAILQTLIYEAIDRGALPNTDISFSDQYASEVAATLWTDNESYSLSVGKSLLDLIRQFSKTAEMEIEAHYNTGVGVKILIDAYKNGIGSDKSSSVYFRIGSNCVEVSSDERGNDLRNALLVKFKNGYTDVEDAASISARRRREEILNIEAAQSGDSATTYASAQLENKKDPKKSIAVKVYDGVNPNVFLDYVMGDTVTLDRLGTLSTYRVLGLQLDFEGNQYPEIIVELNNIIYDNDLRVSNDLDWLLDQWNTAKDANLTETKQWMDINSPDGEVYSLHHYGDYLYVGGNFTRAGNILASYIARYNTITGSWEALSGGSAISQIVIDIIDVSGTIYALTTDKIYRLSGTTWTLIGTAVVGVSGLKNMATDGTDLYICGAAITSITGTSISRYTAKWNGSAWSAVGDNPVNVNDFRALVYYNGSMYAGCATSTIDSIGQFRKLVGSSWNTVLSSLPGTISTGVEQLIVVGDNLVFLQQDGNICLWDGSSSTATIIGATNISSTSAGSALASYLSDLFIGGDFTTIDGVSTYGDLAKYSGGRWVNIGNTSSTAGHRINDIEIIGTDIYIGGLFTTIDGNSISNLAVYVTNFQSVIDHLQHDNQFDLSEAINNGTLVTSLSNPDLMVARQDSTGNILKIAWQNIVGLFAPVAKGVTNGDNHDHDGGDGSPLTAAAMVNRTRYIPVVSVYDATNGIIIPQADAHGTLSQEAHHHLADGVTTIIKSTFPIPVPEDYVTGTVNINFNWSSSVANNNVRWQVIVREVGTNDVVHTSLLVDTSTVAVGATANAVIARSIALTTNPTAGKKLSFNIIRLGADGADSNTGQVSLWGVWLDYTADM